MEGAENGSEQVLLKPGGYNADCPGCKIELKKKMRKGYPLKELFFVGMLVLCSSLPITSLFPYLYFMVKDFNIASKTEDISYFVGFIGSSYMLGRFLTSVLWGLVADRYGRKPVMIMSVCAIIVFNTMFGLSINFWMAISARFLLGSLNGLFGPIKAYALEVCREEHQALGLSIVGTMWGLGLVIGPALGGFLAKPAEKYPSLFSKSSVFGRFPYFLPCICITSASSLVLVATFWLPETLHNHLLECEDDRCNNLQPSTTKKNNSIGSTKGNLTSFLSNWPAMASVTLFCVFSLYDMSYIEIFSLWAVSPKKFGGLNFSTSDLGTILSITGFGLLVFQLLIFPKLANFAGPILTTRIPLVFSIPLIAVHPFIVMLSGTLLWVSTNSASLLKNILSVTADTGMFFLVNNSVPQRQRGLANGVAMTGMSFFKAIGPSSAGAVFAWAEKRQDAMFLPGMQMVFFALNITIFVTLLMTFHPFLPKSLNKPYLE